MNDLSFNKRPVRAQIYGEAPDGLTAFRTDEQGSPILKVGGTQTIAASDFDIRNLDLSDVAAITALNFDIRDFNEGSDSVMIGERPFMVTSNTITLVLGGTTVLTVDTSPYSNGVFLIRADLISLLTTVNLQTAPINSSNYFTTIDSESGLILGGKYLFSPSVQMRYVRVYATGVGSVLTAYYIGQV